MSSGTKATNKVSDVPPSHGIDSSSALKSGYKIRFAIFSPFYSAKIDYIYYFCEIHGGCESPFGNFVTAFSASDFLRVYREILRTG